MKSKKFLTWVLLVVIVLSMTGCGKEIPTGEDFVNKMAKINYSGDPKGHAIDDLHPEKRISYRVSKDNVSYNSGVQLIMYGETEWAKDFFLSCTEMYEKDSKFEVEEKNDKKFISWIKNEEGMDMYFGLFLEENTILEVYVPKEDLKKVKKTLKDTPYF